MKAFFGTGAIVELNLSKGQIVRLLVGLAILVLVLIIYLPRFIYTYSTAAVVTARTVMVRSPIAGVVLDGPPPLGANFDADAPLMTIENKTYDHSKLDAFLIEEKSYEEKINALRAENEEMKHLRDQMIQSNQQYLDSLIERLKIDIEKSGLKQKEFAATVEQTKSELASKTEMGNKGYVKRVIVDEAKYNHERAIKSLEQVDQEHKRLTSALHDLEKGIFINLDGRTDVSYQGQRLDEISLRMSDLEARLREVISRHETTKAARELEQKRINAITRTVIDMPIKGTVWRTFSARDSFVDVNSPLLEVADCENLFMDVTLPERYFEKVKAGQKVTVRLSGSSKSITGEVTSVRGGSIDPKLAEGLVGDTGIRRQFEIEVSVKINGKDLTDSKGNFCHLGRNGEVIFDNL